MTLTEVIMATTTYKKKNSKIKTYVVDKYNSGKAKVKKYQDDLQTAYDIGYKIGWEEAHKIPNRFGARARASAGIYYGIRNRRRSDKYVKKYKA